MAGRGDLADEAEQATTMNASDILNRFDFFRQLSEVERTRGTEMARWARLTDGAWFYHQGQTLDQFALVGSGSLRVYRVGATGREITLYHVRAGETCLVNLLGVLLHREACATALAEGPVTALLLPAALTREWIRSSESFRAFLFENMGQRLIDVMTLVEEVAFGRMDQRLAEYLRRRAEGGAEILVTHEEIACELGTAREVVSRLLASFAQQGVIVQERGRIQVKRLDQLLCAPPAISP